MGLKRKSADTAQNFGIIDVTPESALERRLYALRRSPARGYGESRRKWIIYPRFRSWGTELRWAKYKSVRFHRSGGRGGPMPHSPIADLRRQRPKGSLECGARRRLVAVSVCSTRHSKIAHAGKSGAGPRTPRRFGADSAKNMRHLVVTARAARRPILESAFMGADEDGV
jgi:hypothetical protein